MQKTLSKRGVPTVTGCRKDRRTDRRTNRHFQGTCAVPTQTIAKRSLKSFNFTLKLEPFIYWKIAMHVERKMSIPNFTVLLVVRPFGLLLYFWQRFLRNVTWYASRSYRIQSSRNREWRRVFYVRPTTSDAAFSTSWTESQILTRDQSDGKRPLIQKPPKLTGQWRISQESEYI